MRGRKAVAGLLLGSLACSGTEMVGSSTLLAGTYRADHFMVTPQGESEKDVLAAGGSLVITIEADGSTTGSLNIPASVTGGAAFNASMAGTATVTQLTVEFEQQADTFVRDLIWLRIEGKLTVINAAAGGANYTITLLRD